MSEQYTPEQLKAFKDKDLRIAREACLHAVSRMYNDIKPEVAIEAARELVAFVYEGMEGPKTESKVDVLAPLSEEDKVLKELSGQLKLTYQKDIDEAKMCQLIIESFGKYPSKMESVERVLQAVNFDDCVM